MTKCEACDGEGKPGMYCNGSADPDDSRPCDGEAERSFAGHVGTDHHRSAGHRAWCLECGEWCHQRFELACSCCLCSPSVRGGRRARDVRIITETLLYVNAPHDWFPSPEGIAGIIAAAEDDT